MTLAEQREWCVKFAREMKWFHFHDDGYDAPYWIESATGVDISREQSPPGQRQWAAWNPFMSDSDAIELAVKLKINHAYDATCTNGTGYKAWEVDERGETLLWAEGITLREAVTQAAMAQIGGK